jgi:hypothetical protein
MGPQTIASTKGNHVFIGPQTIALTKGNHVLTRPQIIALKKGNHVFTNPQTICLQKNKVTATVNQHPPVHHPQDACYDSVVDDPQLSYYSVSS